jgi:Protein of unknown function (DUF3551)
MRRLVVGTIASAVMLTASAVDAGSAAQAQQAQRARYCAQYDFSTSNCGFYTAAQCLATISGVGGYCTLGLNGPGVYGSVHGSDTPAASRRYRHYRERD